MRKAVWSSLQTAFRISPYKRLSPVPKAACPEPPPALALPGQEWLAPPRVVGAGLAAGAGRVAAGAAPLPWLPPPFSSTSKSLFCKFCGRGVLP